MDPDRMSMSGVRFGAIAMSVLCHAGLLAVVVSRTSWRLPAPPPQVTISLAGQTFGTAQASPEVAHPIAARDAPATDLPATTALPAASTVPPLTAASLDAIGESRPPAADPPLASAPPGPIAPQSPAPLVQSVRSEPPRLVAPPEAGLRATRTAPPDAEAVAALPDDEAVTPPAPAATTAVDSSAAAQMRSSAETFVTTLHERNADPGPPRAGSGLPPLERPIVPMSGKPAEASASSSIAPAPKAPGEPPRLPAVAPATPLPEPGLPPAEDTAALEPRQDDVARQAATEPAQAVATLLPGPADTAGDAASPQVQTPSSSPAGPVERLTALETSSQRGEVRSFVDRYDGGSCFFVSSPDMTADGTQVDGFSASVAEVNRFHAAFIATFGFEPNVIGQRVWSAQCPAVDFLHRTRREDTPPPRIVIDRVDVGSGQTLSGAIRDSGDRTVRLYLVSESGLVRDLSASLQDRGDEKRFDVPLRLDAPGGPFPEMLLAIAGPRDAAVSYGASPVPAARFFENVPTSNTASAGKLFLLSR